MDAMIEALKVGPEGAIPMPPSASPAPFRTLGTHRGARLHVGDECAGETDDQRMARNLKLQKMLLAKAP